MSRNFYTNTDESLHLNDKTCVINTGIFYNIFNRIASHFRYFELEAKKNCFIDRGVEGIDLEYISTEEFNIFYLRCVEAFQTYPDDFEKQRKLDYPDRANNYDLYVISAWKNVVSMLEKDKRYNPQWIREYEIANAVRSYEN